MLQQSSSGGQQTKKVKIPLFDTKKRVQIILKKVGMRAEEVLKGRDQMYGSVTISLKKLAQGLGSSYLHWVALYENLEDDMYDGQLGEDDYETPRILLEYSVIGGQYTSVMNNMDKIRGEIGQHKLLNEEVSGGSAVV